MPDALESLSAQNRVAQCPASSVLEHDQELAEKEGPAARGVAIHRYLADIPRFGADAALLRVPDEYQEECALIELEGLPLNKTFIQELALAVNLVTGEVRELGRNVGREIYETVDRSVWLCGTLDVVGIYADHVYVSDYKTGHGGERYAPAAARNWQVKLGAVIVARLFGKRRAHCEIIHITSEGWHWKSEVYLDEFDLDLLWDEARLAFAEQGEARAVLLAGGEPEVRPGIFCRHCPAFHSCPQQRRLMRVAIQRPADVESSVIKSLNPEEAARAYTVWQSLKRITDDVGAQVVGYAIGQDIVLADGVVFGVNAEKRPRILYDAAITFAVVEAGYGKVPAQAALTMKASKAGLDRAADKVGAENKAAMVRELTEQIRQRGGITEKPPTRSPSVHALKQITS